MRPPMGVALRKSKGVDSTGFNSPVGMSPASTGVKGGRVQGERMVQGFALSREIEIRTIREIDHGVFVGGGRIFNPQLVLHQRVPNHR